jgi:hypothetical protein
MQKEKPIFKFKILSDSNSNKAKKNKSLFNSTMPPEGVFKPINFFSTLGIQRKL